MILTTQNTDNMDMEEIYKFEEQFNEISDKCKKLVQDLHDKIFVGVNKYNCVFRSFFFIGKTTIGLRVNDTQNNAKTIVFVPIEVFCNEEMYQRFINEYKRIKYEKSVEENQADI